jgi:parvulin-like peptidyl-prolyl isomerase
VVATYDGGQITVDDVRQHLAFLVPDERLREQVRSPEEYRHVVYEMIGDGLVKRWAAGRDVEQDQDFRHVMKHLDEEIGMGRMARELHAGDMGVNQSDVRDYYEANREAFAERTLDEAQGEIRATLQAQQERGYEKKYLQELQQRAVVTRDFSLLEVPEPTEIELRTNFEADRDRYVIPERAVVDELRFSVGADETAARERAQQALVRLRSGAAFSDVAAEFSGEPLPERGVVVPRGSRGPEYDAAVFSLEPGQTSEVFRSGGELYVVRLRNREPERRQELDEVRDRVRQEVLAAKEQTWFRERSGQTLLTIDGRRFTVGEFWEEYQELPLGFQARYRGTEGRRQLAERLIERWIVLQASRRQGPTEEEQAETEHSRLQVLSQMMEQEEVDDKLEVTDDEVRAYFDENQTELAAPPRSRVRYLVVELGETEDDSERAREKADEAYRKLVPGLFRQGEDFVEVAQQYSADPLRAQKPIWVGEGPDLLAEVTQHGLHEYIQNLGEEEIGEPFEWGRAVYIFQVLEREEPRALAFEEIAEPLREELRAQKHQELSRRLNEKLMEKANVTVYENTLRTLGEQARVGARR